MYVLAIANQKGGVGKTTTTQNLGVALARSGKRVLLVDLDAQGNLTNACNVSVSENDVTIMEIFGGTPAKNGIHHVQVEDNISFDLIASTRKFKDADFAFAGKIGRELRLRKALSNPEIDEHYDFCILDCPPSMGIATLNGLAAAHGLIIPVQTQYFAVTGLALLTDSVNEMKEINPNLEILGLVFTMVDRTLLSRSVIEVLEKEWANLVFDTRIPINVKIAEAPSHGKSVLEYEPDATGAKAYDALAKEFLALFD